MADKYITLVDGLPVEREAEAVGGDIAFAGRIPALGPGGTIPASMLPPGGGGDPVSFDFVETNLVGLEVFR